MFETATLERMEDMLIIWIQDMIYKHVPVSTAIIQEQALSFYAFVKENSTITSTETFVASKGWFERFKKRFSLHNVSFSGEKASADHEAAQNFPSQLRELIAEKHYVADQIFNCDETGLYWKRMPSRTYLTSAEKEAPGFKVSKDRFTLLFCANASGNYRCKPMLVYKSETPRALKNKRKDHLPVFWKSNKSAWVNKINFQEWFLQSFIPEVKNFLTKKNLAFKILLLLDNAAVHSNSLQTLDPNVEVIFLPPNTTSLIQPMDQSVISTFKAYYVKRVMQNIVRAMNNACENIAVSSSVQEFWKNFSIFDSIGFVNEAWSQVTESTLNKCWSKLLPEFVKQTEVQETYDQCVIDLLRLAREIGGEGFEDIRESEISELIQPANEGFSAEEINQILTESAEDREETTEVQEPVFTMSSILKIILMVQDAIDEAHTSDPIMTRSLKFKYDCQEALKSYEELRRDMTRRAKQSRVTDYFTKKQ